MNTPNIDILMKAAAPAAKAPPANSPREDGDSFGSYLRDAAEPKVVSEKPPVKEKPAEEQPITTTAGQEQDSTATPDQETIPTEPLETTTEDEANEVITGEATTDELLLSVAASAMVEAEVVVEVPVIIEPTVTNVEVVDPTVAKGELATGTQPASEPVSAPLDIVDATENTTTCSEVGNGNVEKLIPSEPILADEKSVEVAKNGALTSVVEVTQSTVVPQATVASQSTVVPQATVAPQSNVAPKPTKPILPETTTESEGDGEDSKTNKSEPVDIDAAIVEAIAKIVEAAPVTIDTQISDTKAEVSAPAPQAPVSGLQNQSQPVPSHATHSEAPAPHAEGESHMPTIDRARFVQRVANAFRSAQQNDGQIQMRLSPPELGSLKIEIAVRNGVLSANLEAETPDARRVLLDNLPALRQRLAEQDIRIEKFEVDIRQDGGQQQGQAEAQQQQAEEQTQRAVARNRIRTTPAGDVITARVPRGVTTQDNSGLDVRV